MSDDPTTITETDLADWPGNSPWVECELGHRQCMGGDYAENMVHDGDGWICPTCDRIQHEEWEEERRHLDRMRWWL
jgi:hypothetical protein